VVTIVAVVGAGLIMRPAQPPTSGFHAPKDGIEAFGRIDASTAGRNLGPTCTSLATPGRRGRRVRSRAASRWARS
jgi:hypothetical protein